jgi:hypothetical protein
MTIPLFTQPVPGDFVGALNTLVNQVNNAISAFSTTLSNSVSQTYQIVGTRCGTNGPLGITSQAQKGASGRIQHCLPFGAEEIVVVWSGYSSSPGAVEVTIPTGFCHQATAATIVAGGTGYAVGDLITPTVAANQIAPTLVVSAVSGGVITDLEVVSGSIFNAIPATGLATTKVTGSGDNTATVTLTVAPFALGFHLGLEQVWGTQTAYAFNNLNGVQPLVRGANVNGLNKEVLLQSGSYIMTDPVTKEFNPGALIGTRYYTPNGGLPVGRALSGSAGLNEYSVFSNFTDVVAGGAMSTSASPPGGFQPLAILGKLRVPKPNFAIIGDSIAYGSVSVNGATTSGATLDANGNKSWIEKAMNQQVPWTNISVSGETVTDWVDTASRLRWRDLDLIRPGCIFDENCINTISNGVTTFAQLLAYKQELWNRFRSLGVRQIWVPTCTPNSTSKYKMTVLPTIAAGGTGYDVSSTFDVTIAGGTLAGGGTAATVSVTTNSSGVVTTVNSITNAGLYTTKPTSPNAATGGTGSGLSLTISTSFNGWYDLSNQALAASNVAIQAWNAYLRAGNAQQYGVTQVIDICRVVESSLGSGLWALGTTLDGTHPTDSATTAMAAYAAPSFANLSY